MPRCSASNAQALRENQRSTSGSSSSPRYIMSRELILTSLKSLQGLGREIHLSRPVTCGRSSSARWHHYWRQRIPLGLCRRVRRRYSGAGGDPGGLDTCVGGSHYHRGRSGESNTGIYPPSSIDLCPYTTTVLHPFDGPRTWQYAPSFSSTPAAPPLHTTSRASSCSRTACSRTSLSPVVRVRSVLLAVSSTYITTVHSDRFVMMFGYST